ncbi:MAG: hypothetical protein HY334_02590 [Armatimonadetes bacterium]|nr:hypothetical protein [Armatimonadota bacterium]
MHRIGFRLTGLATIGLWTLGTWWAWSWSAERPGLNARWRTIEHLERRVAELQALPPAPPLEPLETVLPAVLGTLPPRTELALDSRESAPRPAPSGPGTGRPQIPVALAGFAAPVPEAHGVGRIRLSVALPQLSLSSLTEGIVRLVALQATGPVEIPALLWQADSKTLSLVLVVYGLRAT